jgi:hypothetical protein
MFLLLSGGRGEKHSAWWPGVFVMAHSTYGYGGLTVQVEPLLYSSRVRSLCSNWNLRTFVQIKYGRSEKFISEAIITSQQENKTGIYVLFSKTWLTNDRSLVLASLLLLKQQRGYKSPYIIQHQRFEVYSLTLI